MSTHPLTPDRRLPAGAAPATRALRPPVVIDAAGSGAFGLALLFGASALAAATGMGAAWLRGIGIFVVGYAGALTLLAFRLRATTAGRDGQRPVHGARLVRTVGVVNLGWVAASVAVVVGVGLTGIGVAVVVAQALFVLGVALWQLRAAGAGR